MSNREDPPDEFLSSRSDSASVCKLDRLSELGHPFRPTLSTEGTGCIGFEAEAYRIEGQVEAASLSFRALSE